MEMQYHMMDPVTGKFYDYTCRDDKEQKLLDALKMALRDECPPDRKDYLCDIGESDEQDCETCILRWATKDFGKYRD